jgi:hypothetical protein
VHAAVTPAEATITATLIARAAVTHAGCADPDGTTHRWLVVEQNGKFFPVKIVNAEKFAKIREEQRKLDSRNPNGREAVGGDILSPEEGARLGFSEGTRVRIAGIYAPVAYSGSIAAAPIYGFCTERVERA